MMDAASAPVTPPRTRQDKHQEYMRSMSPGTLNAYLLHACMMYEIGLARQRPKKTKSPTHTRKTRAKKPCPHPKPVRPFSSTLLQSPERLEAMAEQDSTGIELSPTKLDREDWTPPPSLRKDRRGLHALATPLGASASTAASNTPPSADPAPDEDWF